MNALLLDHPSSALERARGAALVAGAGVLLGTIGVFVREAGQDAPLTVWFRCAIGAVAIAVLAGATGASLRPPAGRAGWLVVAGSGLLMTGNWVLFFTSLRDLPIGLATVAFHVQPLLLMAVGAIALRQRVARSQWIAAVVALAGIGVVVVGRPGALVVADARMIAGLGLCLAAACCYTGVTLIAQRARSVGPIAMAWWQCVVGAACLAWAPLSDGLPAPGPAWGWLAALGVVHTGLAYLMLYAGARRLATGELAILQYVYPVTAVAVDWLAYGQVLHPAQLAGLAAAVAALVFATMPRARSGSDREMSGLSPAQSPKTDISRPDPGRTRVNAN